MSLRTDTRASGPHLQVWRPTIPALYAVRSEKVVTGIVVSKALLDVSMADGPVYRFANSDPGIRRLLQHMDRAGATQVVCEATGGYERLLVSCLRAAGIPVQVAYPLQVRACGYEAKCSRCRTPVRRRMRRNVRSCNNGCADAGNWSISGSRNGIGWTRASVLPSVGPPGGTLPGWTRSTRPCCRAVWPSAHKPRCTAAYRGWAP